MEAQVCVQVAIRCEALTSPQAGSAPTLAVPEVTMEDVRDGQQQSASARTNTVASADDVKMEPGILPSAAVQPPAMPELQEHGDANSMRDSSAPSSDAL